jgi:signal transduction histidine kinase
MIADYARGYEGIGFCMVAKKQYNLALNYFNKALALAQQSKDIRKQAFMMLALAQAHDKLKKYNMVLVNTTKGAALFEQCKEPVGLMGLKTLEGVALGELKHYDEAIVVFESVVTMAKANDSADYLSRAYGYLSECYELTNKPKEALKYLKSYQSVYNQHLNRTDKVAFDSLSVKYESQKKDTQLAQQKLEILQSKQNNTLMLLLATVIVLVVVLLFWWYRYAQLQKLIALENTFQESTAQLQSFNESVSHDLRAPLIKARNTLKDLNGHSLVDKEKIVRLSGFIQEAETIIDAMLHLAQIDKHLLVIKSIPIEDLLNDVILQLPQPDYTKWIITKPLDDLKGDLGLIRQVFVNLLSNAQKFTAQQASPTVTISIQQVDDKTLVEIADNGIGFKESQIKHLFQPFARLDSSIEGTGLGLVIAKKIVEKHDGKIWASTNTKAGAVFLFELP